MPFSRLYFRDFRHCFHLENLPASEMILFSFETLHLGAILFLALSHNYPIFLQYLSQS